MIQAGRISGINFTVAFSRYLARGYVGNLDVYVSLNEFYRTTSALALAFVSKIAADILAFAYFMHNTNRKLIDIISYLCDWRQIIYSITE